MNDSSTEVSVSRRIHGQGAVTDPNLRSFAAELSAKFPPSSLPQGDHSLVGEGGDPSCTSSPREMLFRNPHTSAQRSVLDTTSGSIADRSAISSREGNLCRPRAIPRTTALAVACTVSRMGVANRERKRRVAARLAQKSLRTYTVLPDAPAPNEAEPSAFRVVVARPCPVPSPLRPLDVSRTAASSNRSILAGVGLGDVSAAYSDRKSKINLSLNSLGASAQDSTIGNISGLGTSLDVLNGSTLSRRAHPANESVSSIFAMDRSQNQM